MKDLQRHIINSLKRAYMQLSALIIQKEDYDPKDYELLKACYKLKIKQLTDEIRIHNTKYKVFKSRCQ